MLRHMDAPEPTVVTDARVLRALTHPLRLRLLEEIAFADTAGSTATELAEKVGESPANCSWHLRQLAKYGYIEEAPGGHGRERPWRAVIATRRWGDPSIDTGSELGRAGDAAAELLMDNEMRALHRYQAWRGAESEEWRDAAGAAQAIGWCTADELKEINDQIFQLTMRYFHRMANPEDRPAGARLVRFVGWGVPAQPPSTVKETPDA
jgi:hypothetical protein